MKRFKTVTVLFLTLSLCLSVCGIGVQASALSGDLVANFELTDVAYTDADGEKVYQVEAGTITCKANVINNTTAAQELMLLSAHYDSQGNLKTVGVDKQTVAAKSNSDFFAAVNVSDAAGSVKTYIWGADTQVPYKEVASLTDKSSKKFDEVWFIYQMPGTATEGKKEYRKSYKGVVDEQKGTITFEVPYGREDAGIITNPSKLPYPSFSFIGDETSTITCVGGTYNGDDTAAPAKGERYDGQVLKQLELKDEKSFTDGGWVHTALVDGYEVTLVKGEWNQIDISTERPVFTITAEDGSSVSYKVNILFVLVDDNFSNAAVSDSDSNALTSGADSEWAWKIAKNATGEAGVSTEGDNKFLTVSRTVYDEASDNRLTLELRNSAGNWIKLHTKERGENVKTLVEYDWRYRDVTGTTSSGSDKKYGKPLYYSFRCLNNSGNELTRIEFTNSSNMNPQTRRLNSENDQAVDGQTFAKDTWHHDRLALYLDNSTGGSAETYEGLYANYLFDGCLAELTALKGGVANELSLSQFRFQTSNGNSSDRIAALDLDNLKIGVLFE